jgi:hypothetical protein
MPEQVPMIKARFYKRLAQSMRRELETELADQLLNKAAQLEYESLVYQVNDVKLIATSPSGHSHV